MNELSAPISSVFKILKFILPVFHIMPPNPTYLPLYPKIKQNEI